MSDNTGYIFIHRTLQSHWIWQDANKLKWWLDILLTVNHNPGEVNFGNDVFICNRGQSLLSILSWADRWKVSKDTARNFLKLLEKQKMIECVSIGKSTRLTVCNYDSYQPQIHVKQTHAVRTLSTNNNDNKENIYIVEFDVFWETYGKKVGDKKKSERKWKTLNLETQKKIIEFLPGWKKQFSDIQFQPFPITFLNQERWLDEVPIVDINKRPNGVIDQSENVKLFGV